MIEFGVRDGHGFIVVDASHPAFGKGSVVVDGITCSGDPFPRSKKRGPGVNDWILRFEVPTDDVDAVEFMERVLQGLGEMPSPSTPPQPSQIAEQLREIRKRKLAARHAVLAIEMQESALLEEWWSVKLADSTEFFFHDAALDLDEAIESLVELLERGTITRGQFGAAVDGLGVKWFEA